MIFIYSNFCNNFRTRSCLSKSMLCVWTLSLGHFPLIVFSIFLLSFGLFSLLPEASATSYSVNIPAGTSVPGCEEYDGCFTPSTISINSGDTITWSNDDTAAHTVTSVSSYGSPDGNFDSSLFMAGTSFSVKFDGSDGPSGGVYDYICMVHPWMVGTVLVQGPSTPAPKPTPTPTPAPTIPSSVDVVIPKGTSVPGCEDSNSCFTPYKIYVGQGSSVTWFNADNAAHTVTSGRGIPDGDFDSSLIMSGTSFSNYFKSAGTYPYFCMVHPWQTGYVIVERGSPPPPFQPPITRDTTPPKILKPTDIEVDADDSNGARVTYEVLAIDDTDQIVRPFCSPSSGSFFAIGDTRVSCSATDSAGNRASQVSFTITVNPIGIQIPSWIKNVAAFWCEDKIDDAAFIEGIQYLIDNDIILVSTTSSGYGGSQSIPSWIKNNACWWSEGFISDEDFAAGLEYLISVGVIRV